MCGVSLSRIQNLFFSLFVASIFDSRLVSSCFTGHDFSASRIKMEDASMPDAAINDPCELLFSEAVIGWLQTNQDKLEDMAQKREKMWNIADWQEFEKWSNNESRKFDQAKAKIGSLQRELHKMKEERTQMIADQEHERSQMVAHIRSLEDKADTYSSVSEDYRIGMIAIDALVCQATEAYEMLPPKGEERIMDRLDTLVRLMAEKEKKRMENREAHPYRYIEEHPR